MKVLKKIQTNIINTFKAKYIWIAMLLCMALLFGTNIYGADSLDSTGLIINLIKLKKTELIMQGEEFSREYVFSCFNGNYWFDVLFPAFVGLATVNRFADEWLNGMYYFSTSRVGKRNYAIIEVISCFIVSFLTINICLLLFQIVIWNQFPSITDFEDWRYSIVAIAQGKTYRQRIIYDLFIYMRMGAMAGISSLFSMLLVVVCRDRFFSITIPVMINYLSTKVENYFSIFLFKHAIADSSVINYLKFFVPTMYFSTSGLFVNNNNYRSNVAYLFFLLGIAIFLSFIIVKIITRKDR